jgi:hypothetical protein
MAVVHRFTLIAGTEKGDIHNYGRAVLCPNNPGGSAVALRGRPRGHRPASSATRGWVV